MREFVAVERFRLCVAGDSLTRKRASIGMARGISLCPFEVRLIIPNIAPHIDTPYPLYLHSFD